MDPLSAPHEQITLEHSPFKGITEHVQNSEPLEAASGDSEEIFNYVQQGKDS
jgi:hypothetical protein